MSALWLLFSHSLYRNSASNFPTPKGIVKVLPGKFSLLEEKTM
jgi:hypothetical protein